MAPQGVYDDDNDERGTWNVERGTWNGAAELRYGFTNTSLIHSTNLSAVGV